MSFGTQADLPPCHDQAAPRRRVPASQRQVLLPRWPDDNVHPAGCEFDDDKDSPWFFKANGCYLDDICHEPVDKLPREGVGRGGAWLR